MPEEEREPEAQGAQEEEPWEQPIRRQPSEEELRRQERRRRLEELRELRRRERELLCEEAREVLESGEVGKGPVWGTRLHPVFHELHRTLTPEERESVRIGVAKLILALASGQGGEQGGRPSTINISVQVAPPPRQPEPSGLDPVALLNKCKVLEAEVEQLRREVREAWSRAGEYSDRVKQLEEELEQLRELREARQVLEVLLRRARDLERLHNTLKVVREKCGTLEEELKSGLSSPKNLASYVKDYISSELDKVLNALGELLEALRQLSRSRPPARSSAPE